MTKEYELHIETNKYAGNFERELCAYVTGVIGECEVGDKEASIYHEEENYVFNLRQVADENGYERPVQIIGDCDSLAIYLEKKLSDEEISIIQKRLKKYAEMNDLQILSVKQFKKKITYKEVSNIKL